MPAHRYCLTIFLGLAFGLALAGCESKTSATPSADAGPDSAAHSAWTKVTPPKNAVAGGTLTIGLVGGYSSLNFLTVDTNDAELDSVLSLVSGGLTREHPGGKVGPALAESWEFSRDRRLLTFKLRKGVLWSDGKPVTARDVEFTFRASQDADIDWRGRRWRAGIVSCEAVGDHTVRFLFREPYRHQLLDATFGYVLPSHALSSIPFAQWKSREETRAPAGLGPYRVEKWESDRVTLVPNPHYSEGKPPTLERVVLRFYGEAEATWAALQTGEVDFVPRVPPKGVPGLESNLELTKVSRPTRAYVFLGWNLRDPRLGSRELRDALTRAIDRERLIRGVYFGDAELIDGPIPATCAEAAEVERVPFSKEEAESRLEAQAWKLGDDGVRSRGSEVLRFRVVTNNRPVRRTVFKHLARDLKAVGVELEPVFLDWKSTQAALESGDFDAFIGGWSVARRTDLRSVWASDGRFNSIGFSMTKIDDALALLGRLTDPAESEELWREVQTTIAGEVPYTFLYNPKSVGFMRKSFHGTFDAEAWGYRASQWTLVK